MSNSKRKFIVQHCVVAATFWITMLLPGLALCETVSALAPPPPPRYDDHIEDLVVKTMGGQITIKRTFIGYSFYPNVDWVNIGVRSGINGSSNGDVISRSTDIYKKVSTGVYVFLRRYTITQTPTGYRWSDRKGNWIDYDQNGFIVKSGNKNIVVLTFQHDAAGNITGVFDTFNNQILWYDYATPLSTTSVAGGLYLWRPLSAIRDSSGRKVQYNYDTIGTIATPKVVTITDVNGFVWKYEAPPFGFGTLTRTDPEGRVIKLVGCFGLAWDGVDQDKIGTTTKCGYDKYKKLYYIQAKTSNGRVDESWNNQEGVRVRWDLNGNTLETTVVEGRRRTITDRNGNKTVIDYDEWDNIVRKAYPDGTSVSYTYDPLYSNVTREVDENGTVTQREFDTKGNLTKQTDAVGRIDQHITEYTYDAYGNVKTITLKGDAQTPDAVYRYDYDNQGNITSFTDPENSTRTFTYDVMGNVLTVVDARQKTWTYTYDNFGRMKTEKDPLQKVVKYDYNKVGSQTGYTDANNKSWTLTYNRQQWLTDITDPYGKTDHRDYNLDGQVTKEIDSEGVAVSYDYDPAGRLVKITDGNGNVSTQLYADSGAQGVGSFAQASRVDYPTYSQLYQYDGRNRLSKNTSLVGSDGYVSSFGYNGTGRVTSETDPNGKTAFSEYDSYDNLRKYTNRNGAAIELGYDKRSNIAFLKDAKGNTNTFSFDRNDRLKTETRPLGQSFQYEYDEEGNLKQIIDPKGQKIKYTYDDAGRTTQVDYFTLAGDTTAGASVSYGYDGVGNITNWSDGTQSGTLAYDDAGRLTGETINYGAFSLSYHYTYRANGQKASFAGPDNITYTYTYGPAYELTGIEFPAGSITYGQHLWNTPRSVTLPGGTIKAFDLNAFLSPISVSIKDPGQNIVATVQTAYGKGLEVAEQTIDGVKTVYSYDNDLRLTGATSPSLNETFNLDAAGNRNSDNTGSYTHNTNNQTTAAPNATYSYDPNGNLSQKTEGANVTYYYYDVQNRLVRIEDTGHSVIARYGYDPFDRRLWKETNNTKTYYLYADEGLIGEYNDSGNQTRSYGYQPDSDWGTDPVYTRIGSTYYYYHNDHLSTPLKLTGGDGAIVWSANYSAYGKATIDVGSAIESNLRLPGQYFDAESKLHYNGRRYYDPEIGRYISEDPIGFDGGSNLYRYSNADPINEYDNTGECGLIGAAKNVLWGIATSGGCLSWGSVLTDAALGAICLPRFPKLPRGPKPRPKPPRTPFKAEPSCSINSFTGDTLVTTKDGLKPIDTIHIGDEVLSFAEWNNNAQSYQKVEDVISSEHEQLIVHITLDNNETIHATDGHPVYVEGQGWRDARLLKVGDRIKTASELSITVKETSTERKVVKVYNLTVANNHTFYVGTGRVGVHNVKNIPTNVPAKILVPGRLKRSESYASELEEMNYPTICDLAAKPGNLREKAKKMKKLIEQKDRLMDKLRGR